MENVFLLSLVFRFTVGSLMYLRLESQMGRWSILSHVQGRNLLLKSQFQDKYVIPAIHSASQNTAVSKCFMRCDGRGIIKLQRGINCIMFKKSVEKERHYWKATSSTPPPKFIFGRRKINWSDLLGHPICSWRPSIQGVLEKGECVLASGRVRI